MMNWNDIRVEQQIAQERYNAIIGQGQSTSTTDLFRQGCRWLGSLLVAWGNQLQYDEKWSHTPELAHSAKRSR